MRRGALVLAACALGAAAAPAAASIPPPGVPNANHRAGHPANEVAPGFTLEKIAQGSNALENPSGLITKFGFLNDGATQPVEATKTEADQNTYVVFRKGLPGPRHGYDYGTHFLFQAHEGGTDIGYVTRINLDVTDPAHRITLLTPVGSDGLTHLNALDGTTWDPFTHTLLATQENGSDGGVTEVTVGWPPKRASLDGILGKGSYEGIHPDDRGNLVLAEDSGGTEVSVDPSDPSAPEVAKQPNSFMYRFVPKDRFDLSRGGKLQALQVHIHGHAVRFHAANPSGDVFSQDRLRLHTLGTSWPARWITVHNTATDGSAPFDANALAKAGGATPFERPENVQFRPGSGFSTFVFTATGDTNADSGSVKALARRGAWGSLFTVHITDGTTGRISILALGDAVHSSFDNVAFADRDTLLAGEDRGDGLHAQLNRLDSIWAYDMSDPGHPVRFLALGRDTESQADAALSDAGTAGFQNEGDNETTGVHVSSGSPFVAGMQGRTGAFSDPRWFFTQQHGKNHVWEILRES
jgi:Alkaline phosphatase PhoX